ncbi:MAG: ABC transporter permease [Cytophagia bacterium]|nr:ABC transporter permease [Cytophagia bacterium]
MNFHFKFALREIIKNKLIAFSSLASVIVGVFSAYLIYIWVDTELSTDDFHSNLDRIYIPVVQQSAVDNIKPISAGLFFRVDYSKYTNVQKKLHTGYYSPERIKFTYGNRDYRGGGLVADSTFFDFFDFQLLTGDSKEIMNDPSSIILTESFAKKVFGDIEVLGKIVHIESDQKGDYQVAGILKDIPTNSTLQFDFLVPTHSQSQWMISGQEFILVSDSFDPNQFNEEFKHAGRNHPQFKESTLSVIPFKDIYFHYNFSNELLSRHGNLNEVNTLLIVAFVILLVSILNFTNMQSTLMISQLRIRGIKEVNGATRADFILDMLASRLIYFLFALLVSFGLFLLIKPLYLRFLEISFDKNWVLVLQELALGLLAFLLLSTIFSLLQSTRIATSQALAGQLRSNGKGLASKVLTTIQYACAIVLIIASMVVFKQFKYMQKKDLGYDSNDLISVKFFDRLPYNFDDYEAYKNDLAAQKSRYQQLIGELERIPGIVSFSQGELPFDGTTWDMSWKLAQSEFEYSTAKNMTVDPSYAELLGLNVVVGRFFSDSLDVSRQNKVVINRAAMEFWGITNLEEGISLASSSWGDEEEPWKVIGVVEDFHFEHLSKKIEPVIMVFFEDVEREFAMRLSPQQYQGTLQRLTELFADINPNQIFSFTVLEDKLNAQYAKERKLSQIFMLFTSVGLVISSLGLFTFALYDTRKRIKEIGIRKVIGASVEQVVSLLSANFLRLVILAFLVACPVGWYLMKEWLANFANQTALSWWIFVSAGGLTVLLALLTVIGQSYSAARSNPVEALRHE